jgi:hypothetical protein
LSRVVEQYRLIGKGYSICVAFLKLFEKVYAPLTAAYWRRFAEIAPWRKKCAAHSTASTNTSAMAWTHCCEPSVSRIAA